MSEPTTHRVDVGDWTLGLEVLEPPDEAPVRGVVLAGHAMMCNRRTLDRPRGGGLASALASRGLRVVSFDARGHGDSGPRAAEGGAWRYHDIVHGDVPGIVGWARERWPDLPRVLLGHSLVGHAALFWLGLNPEDPGVDAVVALGANFWLPRFEPSWTRWQLKRAVTWAWWRVTVSRGYFPVRDLKMGSEDEAKDYVEDFVTAIRDNALRDPDTGEDYAEALARVPAPVLGLFGSRDRLLCPPEVGRRFLAPIPDHEVRVVPDVDHMGLATDLRARPAWEACADWILMHCD